MRSGSHTVMSLSERTRYYRYLSRPKVVCLCLDFSFIQLTEHLTLRCSLCSYHLLTTLARDLSGRYPSFKTALGRIVKDNSSLRVGTRTLFESLILGPILVVIDALDESGDVTGGNGLNTLAKALSRLPSHFRLFITSRPEHDIESAFVGAPSVPIKHTDDLDLAAKTHDDILAFLRERHPSEEFRNYGLERLILTRAHSHQLRGY